MGKQSETTERIFRHLMQKGQPLTAPEIARELGLDAQRTVQYLGHNPDLFVRTGRLTGKRGAPTYLWAAWEE